MGRAYSPAWRRRGMHIGFCWESQKERDNKGALGVGGRIIINGS
jgi:hypothetical protein